MKKLDLLILKYKKEEYNLLTLLEETVKVKGFLSFETLNYISKNLKIPLAKLYGMASFYSFLPTTKTGKYLIRVCNSPSCYLNGSQKVLEILKKFGIEVGKTTKDGKFTMELTSCIGCCDSAPAMMINNKVYTNLDRTKIRDIIKRLK
jgi:NADH:ubiquinone oxidoreductase subunit E